MSNRSIGLTETLHDYLLSVSLRETPVMRELREETARHPQANMQIAPEQGQFMALLVRLLGAGRTLEIGAFTGYSAIAVARALPDDGRIVTCDVSEEYTAIARRYWKKANVEDKIELRLAPAIETLDALLAGGLSDYGGRDTFDFSFIDADKTNYDAYYERSLQLVRPGGLIAFDNTLWDGKVADETAQDADTRALRALNKKLYADERIDLSLVPIADGLTLCRKR